MLRRWLNRSDYNCNSPLADCRGNMSEKNAAYLSAGPTVESNHPGVIAYADAATQSCSGDVDRAIALYYAVRDGIRYDPYSADLSVAGLKASRVLELERGWCVSKAILLAAGCRTLGIPARLGFADVRNHLSTEKMRQRMKTDVFYWHGYAALYLDECWVKATPAFNIELCEKFNLKPLEFDGREDSIYHPFDQAGNRHMEYLRELGEFSEPPIEEMCHTFEQHYPGWPDKGDAENSNFDAEVEDESANRAAKRGLA